MWNDRWRKEAETELAGLIGRLDLATCPSCTYRDTEPAVVKHFALAHPDQVQGYPTEDLPSAKDVVDALSRRAAVPDRGADLPDPPASLIGYSRADMVRAWDQGYVASLEDLDQPLDNKTENPYAIQG